MMMTDEFVCTYQVSELGETPIRCNKKAVKLVVWPPETTWGTMTYCKTHWNAVDRLDVVNNATEITELGTDAA